MTARAPLAILLLAALGLAAWLALSSERTPRAPRPEAVAGEAAAPAEPVPVEAEMNADELATTADAARVPVAARESAAPPAMLEILVVDSESKEPVADAEVWVVAHAALPPWPRDPRMRHDYMRGGEQRAREHGHGYRTDAAGCVRIRDPGPGNAVARAGNRYGEASIGVRSFAPGNSADRDENRNRIRIELAIDRTLRLRAIDPAGVPVAGLALALRMWTRLQYQPGATRPERLAYPLGWTDSDGRLVVQHAQYWLPRIDVVPSSGRRSVEVVLPEGGFDESARVSFDAGAWPEQELIVPVPATGSIVVELRGGSVERAAARLRLAEDTDHRLSTAMPFGSDRRARFPHVALGKSFRVTLARAARIACDVIGPVQAEQSVTCRLDIAEAPPELRYRLLDEQRSPLPGRAPQLRFGIADGSGIMQAEHTDADGIGYCALLDAWLGRRVEWIDFELPSSSRGAPLRRRVEIGRVLGPGTNDIGEIVLAEPALLAAGTVSGATPDALLGSSFFVESLVADPRGGEPQWRGLDRIAASWSASDRFELRRDCSATRLRLTLLGPRLPPGPPIEFSRGDRNVRLELAALGGIELRLLLDEGLEGWPIRAEAIPCERQRLPNAQIRTRFDPEAAPMLHEPRAASPLSDPGEPDLLRWHGLVPGHYRIELFAGLQPKLLLAPIEVRVLAGEMVRAPDVDLRGRLKRIRIELQRAAGEPWREDDSAVVLLRNAGDTWPGETCSDGRCELLLAEPADLAIFARGYERKDLDQLFEDRVVRLVPGPRVRVQFDLSRVAIPAGARCLVSLVGSTALGRIRFRTGMRSGSLDSLLSPEPVALGPDQGATWRLEESGEYSISIRLDPHSHALTSDPPAIHVTGAPEQQFQIEVRLQ